MMSSIFSSFEAMGAESYGWKLVNSTPYKISATPTTTSTSTSTTKSSSVAENNSNSSLRVSSSPRKIESKDMQKKTMKRNPRFALELDGVHCFETIVPY